MKSVLLGLSGSIACYKSAELTRLLRRRAVGVRVAMTPAAARLVGAPTFRALSGAPVLLDEWRRPQADDGMDHIAAVRAADALLVAPASADFIAKAANGISDNLLLAAFLAADCRRIIAPAMNAQMWAAAATQRNIRRLREDGAEILPPADGEQACGETGLGRMMEPADIVARLLAAPLRRRRIVVSAGATVEALDQMRVISNRSSGRMGFAVAAAAAGLGADAVLIAGQTALPPPADLPCRRAVSGEEMRQAVLAETAAADWFFSVAAVADFRPAETAADKPQRENGEFSLKLEPTADILAEVRQTHPAVHCVGFAAQSGDADEKMARAREKMARKNLQWLVLNDAADAERDDCQLTLLRRDGEPLPLPRLPKAAAARQLLNAICFT